MDKQHKIGILLILILGIAIRLYKLDLPLLEFYPTRQVQTAEITRNLYREGFDIFSPSVRFYGPGPGFLMFEFPAYNLAVAGLYAILGFESEILGRAFSIFGWIFSFFFLWQLSNKYIGRIGTTTALFFYTFSPLSVMISRSFQPDQWMLTLTLGAIYFIIKWSEKIGKIHLYLSSILFLLLAILVKIPAIIFTFGTIAFFLLKVRTRNFLKIIYLILALLPALVWYAFILISRENIAFGENYNRSFFFSSKLIINLNYYSTIFGHLLNFVLLPVGILLFAIGISIKLVKNQFFLYWWLVSVGIYFLIFNVHNTVHEYYNLPILPIAAIFIGLGFEKFLAQLKNIAIPRGMFMAGIFVLIFLMFLPPIIARAWKLIDRYTFVLETAEEIKRLTSSNDLIVGSMDAGPTLVYYADRTGWGLDLNPERLTDYERAALYKNIEITDPIMELEKFRMQGAVIFASANKEQFLSNEKFSTYMFQKYPILLETNNYIIFDLPSSL